MYLPLGDIMRKIIGLVFGTALLVAPAMSFGQSQSPQDRPQPKGADQSTQNGGDQAHENTQQSGNNNSATSSANSKASKNKGKKSNENGKQSPSAVESDPTVPNNPGIK